MTDIPIIFSAPMVQALLSSRKTMTRRLAWRPARKGESTAEGSRLTYEGANFVKQVTGHFRPSPWRNVKVGDRLWVRENHRLTDCECTEACRGAGHVWYDASDEGYRNVANNKLRPSIHMPRWASRLTLVVTGTKVERLQDISKADVMAEGILDRDGAPMADVYAGWHEPFAALWTRLHGKESWDENPEVVALSFSVVKANIDAPEALAA